MDKIWQQLGWTTLNAGVNHPEGQEAEKERQESQRGPCCLVVLESATCGMGTWSARNPLVQHYTTQLRHIHGHSYDLSRTQLCSTRVMQEELERQSFEAALAAAAAERSKLEEAAPEQTGEGSKRTLGWEVMTSWNWNCYGACHCLDI